jgi:Hydroxypyruvate isomerase
MLKLSANISLLYPELDFLARVGAASRAGFGAIEVMYPYDHCATELAKALRDHGMRLSVLNSPPGDYGGGERGLAAVPGQEQAFRLSIEQAIDYAMETQCSNVHVLTGNIPTGAQYSDVEPTLHDNLLHAAERFAQAGLTLLLEPLSRYVLPRYSMTTVEQASFWYHVIKDAGFDNVALQVDLYHTQMEQGNLAALIQQYIAEIAYIQIAGVPGRHEPTVGEINYRYLLELLESLQFDGWVGCEYIPQGDTDGGLAWAREWGLLKAPLQRSSDAGGALML